MNLPDPYPYKSLPKYPGLRPRDEAIWEDFLLSAPEAFDHVWYDLPIGEPTHEIDEQEEMKRSGAFQVLQWRVDVLAVKDKQFYVVEIKPDALAGAIGQALAYSKLLEKYGSFPHAPYPVVLTNEINPITAECGSMLGVAIISP